MNTPNLPVPAGTHGGPKLTMRDIVKWIQEEAYAMGELDFHTNFPNPSDIFKPFTLNTDPSGEEENLNDTDIDAAMTAEMQALHRQINGLQQRKQIMDANKALVSQTELHVTQKLLAAGVPKEKLGPETTLRQKVVELVRLTRPEPEPNFVSVWVEAPSTTEGQSQALEVNLPLEASVIEVYALLGEVVVDLFSSRGFTYERGGKWKYQLVDHSNSQVLPKESLPLETDFDYRGLVQRTSIGGDHKKLVAVLVQEGSSVRPINTKEAGCGGARAMTESMSDEEELDDELEVLDDDGKPFFEPLNMDKMAKKYAEYANSGEDLTEENGIHGFWR